jgi:hypothetical protein
MVTSSIGLRSDTTAGYFAGIVVCAPGVVVIVVVAIHPGIVVFGKKKIT